MSASLYEMQLEISKIRSLWIEIRISISSRVKKFEKLSVGVVVIVRHDMHEKGVLDMPQNTGITNVVGVYDLIRGKIFQKRS